MISTFQSLVEKMQSSNSSSSASSSSSSSSFNPSSAPHRFAEFTWGERIQMVPEGFKLPLGSSILDLFFLWFLGNASLNYQPYRFLKWYSFGKDKALTIQLTKYRKVMNCIVQAAIRELVVETVREVELIKDSSLLRPIFVVGFNSLRSHLKLQSISAPISIFTLVNHTCPKSNPKKQIHHPKCSICHHD
jgi:hypothetical protein